EVMATLQGVDGIVAVDVDTLDRTDGIGGSGLDQPLPAAVPDLGSLGDAEAAELLTLSSDPIAPGDMPWASTPTGPSSCPPPSIACATDRSRPPARCAP